jgi:hypothetical protein
MLLAYEKRIIEPALMMPMVVAKSISSEKLVYGKIRRVLSKSITMTTNIIAKAVMASFLFTLNMRKESWEIVFYIIFLGIIILFVSCNMYMCLSLVYDVMPVFFLLLSINRLVF